MNIALLCRSLPCHLKGGLEYHTLTLAQELNRLGHSVTLLTTQHTNNLPCPIKYTDVEVIHLPNTIPGKYSLSYFQELNRKIRTTKHLDIIHSQGFAGIGNMFIKSHPLICTIHGTLTSETELFYKQSIKKLWQYRNRLMIYPFYRFLLKKSDSIIVDSRFSRDLLLNEYPAIYNKIHIIPLGIQTDFFVPKDKKTAKDKFQLPDSFTILTLGRLTASKGIQVILRAMPYLKDLPITLVIAGDGPYRNRLESLQGKLQLDNVIFTGSIELDLLPELYNTADLFIHPDLTAPAFGLVTVEAMACGIPVIASHAGALPEIITPDSGFLFPRGDSEHLARLIRILYEDSSIRNEMKYHTRNRVELFYNSQLMAKNIESVYKNMLGNNH